MFLYDLGAVEVPKCAKSVVLPAGYMSSTDANYLPGFASGSSSTDKGTNWVPILIGAAVAGAIVWWAVSNVGALPPIVANPNDYDEALLPQIDKKIYEGGGWARIKDLPGGKDYIWDLIDRGVLEEDGEFVRRKQAKANPIDPQVGDVFDQFGQKWTVTRVFKKKREVWVEGDQGRDAFGKPHSPRHATMHFRDLESMRRLP